MYICMVAINKHLKHRRNSLPVLFFFFFLPTDSRLDTKFDQIQGQGKIKMAEHNNDKCPSSPVWHTPPLGDSERARKEHHRADLQPKNPLWETAPAPAIPLPCLHRLRESLQLGLACSSVGNHEEAQHQRQPYPSHQMSLWQGHQCSPLQRQHRRLAPNNSWSPTGMSTLTHSLFRKGSWLTA